MLRNLRYFLIFCLISFLIFSVSIGFSQPPYTPPPPPAGKIFIFYVIVLFVFLVVLILIWRTKSKGAILGAIWGLIGPILYWALIDLKLVGIKTILKIIALPLFIYSKIFIPESAPGGSFYYSPIIVFPFSIAVGALIGYLVEKIYRKFKSK